MKLKILSKNFQDLPDGLSCMTVVLEKSQEGDCLRFSEFDELTGVFSYPISNSINKKGCDFDLEQKTVLLSGHEKMLLIIGKRR